MAARRSSSVRPGAVAAKTGNGNTFKSRRSSKNGKRTSGERHMTEREKIAPFVLSADGSPLRHLHVSANG